MDSGWILREFCRDAGWVLDLDMWGGFSVDSGTDLGTALPRP